MRQRRAPVDAANNSEEIDCTNAAENVDYRCAYETGRKGLPNRQWFPPRPFRRWHGEVAQIEPAASQKCPEVSERHLRREADGMRFA